MNPRKSILSRYSAKNINTQYYGSIDVASGTTNENIVFMPYVMSQSIPIIDDWFVETTEEKAERIREERKEKLKRIFC